MKNSRIYIAALCAVFFLFTDASLGQIPRKISYQGVLTDGSGNLIPDGNHSLTIRLYGQASGGSALYEESQSTLVTKGLFNIIIGTTTPIPASLTFDQAYYLGVSVDGGTELVPRLTVTSAPYALYAETAGVANSLSPTVTGIVTSVNNQTGALTLQGAGSTTVTNAGNVFTISSSGGGGGTGWGLTGNAATDPLTNFLGTTDNKDLVIKTNGLERIRFTANGLIDATQGAGNLFIGKGAGSANAIGGWNTAFGVDALSKITTARFNTAIGDSALPVNTTGDGNTAIGHRALLANTTGRANTALGLGALKSNTTGIFNTASGVGALQFNTIGIDNTAFGWNALASNTSAAYNVAVGRSALEMQSYSPDSLWTTGNTAVGYASLRNNQPTSVFNGVENTAIGAMSLGSNTIGSTNTASGARALMLNTTGSENTANGYRALYSNTTGGANTASGGNALYANTIGYGNIASGASALANNTTASYNVAIGMSALYAQSFSNGNTGWNSYNTAIGYQTLYNNQPTSTLNGINNTAVGNQSLRNNTTGTENTGSGALSLFFNTTGNANTSSGMVALYSNTKGNFNSAVGVGALNANTTASRNVGIGVNALRLQSFSNGNTEWNSDNTAVGYEALYSNQPTSTTNGYQNTALGALSLRANSAGAGNTASGYSALTSNTRGSENTAYGLAALANNKTASRNTAIGVGALEIFSWDNGNTVWSSNNTALGYRALYATQGTATTIFASSNTAIGSQALTANTSGYQNTALGADALSSNTGGSNNTALGYQANVNSGTYVNATVIGSQATVTASNKVRVGNFSVTSIVGSVDFAVESDRRIKTNISNGVHGLDFILKLRPVTYQVDPSITDKIIGVTHSTIDYPEKHDIKKITFSGFLAQEVEKAANDIGYDFSGVDKPKNDKDLYSLRYGSFVVPLVKAVQEQQVQINSIGTVNSRVVELEQTVSDQQQIIDNLLLRLQMLEQQFLTNEPVVK